MVANPNSGESESDVRNQIAGANSVIFRYAMSAHFNSSISFPVQIPGSWWDDSRIHLRLVNGFLRAARILTLCIPFYSLAMWLWTTHTLTPFLTVHQPTMHPSSLLSIAFFATSVLAPYPNGPCGGGTSWGDDSYRKEAKCTLGAKNLYTCTGANAGATISLSHPSFLFRHLANSQ